MLSVIRNFFRNTAVIVFVVLIGLALIITTKDIPEETLSSADVNPGYLAVYKNQVNTLLNIADDEDLIVEINKGKSNPVIIYIVDLQTREKKESFIIKGDLEYDMIKYILSEETPSFSLYFNPAYNLEICDNTIYGTTLS